jgi:hypothetical protein
MIELSEEQRLAIMTEENPTVVDPSTQASYILVRKEVFDRIKGLLLGESDESELRLQLARSAAANGWDDPLMDAYDHYDENRSSP